MQAARPTCGQEFGACCISASGCAVTTQWQSAGSPPRVPVDGEPERAPWIDLIDLHKKGAAVVWNAGGLRTLPKGFRAIAAGAHGA